MRKLITFIAVTLIILSSGCVNVSPEDFAMANPLISRFLEEHPNARISVTHFSRNQAEGMLDIIKKDCDNPYLEAKEYYRITVTDNETGLKAVVWIDWENRIVECAYKETLTGAREYSNKTVDGTRCIPHYIAKCHDNHVYWFDSCGNRQEKKEYCKHGCAEGKCIGPECKSHAKIGCYGRHVYWFDSCGHVQEKKEYCEYGCKDGRCIEGSDCKECVKSGGYCLDKTTAVSCKEGYYHAYTTPGNEVCCLPRKTCEEIGGYCIYPGENASITGMITDTAHDSSEENVYSECKEGYYRADYYCPDNGICCAPKKKYCDPEKEYEEPECICPEGYVMTAYNKRVCEKASEAENESEECKETDGGYNIYEKGTAYTSDGRSLTDHCNPDGTLTEKFCKDGGITWEVIR
ncbi:MAG TPA: hypothetical protein ENG00_00625, partial [Candidatus Aenigmarchaeota archaeon]|nr:hypothetical protein [Candidatus Aenigmarchaeota archaeon]